MQTTAHSNLNEEIRRLEPDDGNNSQISLELGGSVMAWPLVTVITVVYNGAKFIEKTIQSVIAQTYRNIEYIIVDGGSTDGTLEIIERYRSHISCLLSEGDAGIYDAMNKGLRLANGEYVGIIGAGDWYDNDAISKATMVFLKTGADVVYGDVEIVDVETNIAQQKYSRHELMPITMSSISHPSLFTKRSIYLNRAFDTRFKIAADYDLFLHLYVEGYRFLHSTSRHVHIVTGGVSSSFATSKEVYLVHKHYLGLFHAKRYFAYSCARYVFYKLRRKLLRTILPQPYFSLIREKWLKHKYK